MCFHTCGQALAMVDEVGCSVLMPYHVPVLLCSRVLPSF
jgi:hypothetical protein